MRFYQCNSFALAVLAPFLWLCCMSGINAEEGDGSLLPIGMEPGYGPVPHVHPKIPKDTTIELGEEEKLEQKIKDKIKKIDIDIKQIRAAYDGIRPQRIDFGNAFKQEQLDRDTAKQKLIDILEEIGEREGVDDPIETVQVEVSDHMELRLRAQNKLDMARCYYTLGTTSLNADVEKLDKGLALLSDDSLSVSDLASSDRIFVLYYRCVLTLAKSEHVIGDEHDKLRRQAEHYAVQMQSDYPNSYLTLTVKGFLAEKKVALKVRGNASVNEASGAINRVP